MRRDLRAALEAFVATHRGLRVGRVFGAPAGFAGRRVFARLSDAGLQLRLPRSVRDAKLSGASARRAAPPGAKRPVSSEWVTVGPSSQAAQRLEILLEQAARYVALA